MRAVVAERSGEPDVLGVQQRDEPEPGAGQVRVRVAAAGVNFIDTHLRSGNYSTDYPKVLGLEVAGTVEAVGADVTEWTGGDRVATAAAHGGYAESALVDAAKLVAVPEGVDLETAAAVMLQGMTAHYLACSTFPLAQGQFALVHAAAGGVGSLLTQIAARRGARVLGSTSTEQKAKLVAADGAERVIRYRDESVADAVADATDGEGVHVVYDAVGKATFEASLASLRTRGTLVLYGGASGAVAEVDTSVFARKSLFFTRPSLPAYTATSEELRWRANDLFGWLTDGSVQLRVDRRFALEDATEAHRYMQDGQTTGKLLLVP